MEIGHEGMNSCLYEFKDKSKLKASQQHLTEFHLRACFSDLLYLPLNNLNSVVFKVRYNVNLNIEAAQWYLDQLKEWGFKFELLTQNKKGFEARVTVQSRRESLVTLMVLRYLDHGEGIHFIVNKSYEWSKKYPDIDAFYLFQLAHFTVSKYNDYGFNSNHTLLDENPTSKLCDIRTFWSRLKAYEQKSVDFILREYYILNTEECTDFVSLIYDEDFYGILSKYS